MNVFESLEGDAAATRAIDPTDAPATVYLRATLLLGWEPYLDESEYWGLLQHLDYATEELTRRRSAWQASTRRIAAARATTPRAVALRSTPVATSQRGGVRQLLTTIA